jgi:DNA-binding MarR family transcriptional regulator
MTDLQNTAQNVLDTIPLVMRTIRSEMRRHGSRDLSVPQFRILNFINLQPESSLSTVAEHMGLALPSVSHMVDVLVERRLLKREMCKDDRRRIKLALTSQGQTLLEAVLAHTQTILMQKISGLSSADLKLLEDSMLLLQTVFKTERN